MRSVDGLGRVRPPWVCRRPVSRETTLRERRIAAVRAVLGWQANGDEYDDDIDATLLEIVIAVEETR